MEGKDAAQRSSESDTAWMRAFKKQLKNNPNFIDLQQKVIKILLEMEGELIESKPRAINKKDLHSYRPLLTRIFGQSARVKVIETLIRFPGYWFNLGELAKLSGVGKSSAKRVIDELESQELELLEESNEETNERLVRLKEGSLGNELLFFYMKLKGIL
ncbi:MAG: hypothetical protein ACTSVI_16530 [Promethearchaeota archaeon]